MRSPQHQHSAGTEQVFRNVCPFGIILIARVGKFFEVKFQVFSYFFMGEGWRGGWVEGGVTDGGRREDTVVLE